MGKIPELSDLRALIVDDSNVMRLLMRTLLEKAGVREVRDVDGGTAALALLKDWTPDIALIDHQMPEMDGPDLIRRIRLFSGPDGLRLPVLLVTASSEKDIGQLADDAGADDGLLKPFDGEKLLQSLQRCLAKVLGQPR